MMAVDAPGSQIHDHDTSIFIPSFLKARHSKFANNGGRISLLTWNDTDSIRARFVVYV